MPAPTWPWTSKRSDYDHAFDDGITYAPAEFFPGERIGEPLARTRGKRLRRGAAILLLTLAGGWAALDERTPELLSQAKSLLEPLLAAKPPPPVQSSPDVGAQPTPDVRAQPATEPSPLQELPSSEVAVAPGTTGAPPATEAAAPSGAAGEQSATGNARPAATEPADPLLKRAEAAGLNPGLSRVLLAKLSDADFKNAAIAIKTALAETPEAGVFTWPKQDKPDQAMFEVHFVPGASSNCRRYVVTITKDRWSTTALPMEKCGGPKPGKIAQER